MAPGLGSIGTERGVDFEQQVFVRVGAGQGESYSASRVYDPCSDLQQFQADCSRHRFYRLGALQGFPADTVDEATGEAGQDQASFVLPQDMDVRKLPQPIGSNRRLKRILHDRLII